MNLRRHMRHKILWRRAESQGEWSTEYSVPEEIPARVEEKGRLGGAATLSENEATTNILVEADVHLGDQLSIRGGTAEEDFDTVETREEIVDFRGRRLGWKLYLEAVQRS